MKRPILSAKRKRRLSFGLLILGMPLIMGQLEDCLSGLDPKPNAKPLALDCVSNGAQIYMPIYMSVTAERAPIALTGTLMDTTVTAEIPPAMFCALEDAQATQTDIDSAATGINFDGIMPPGDTFALHTAINLPIQNIDILAACAGTGPVLVDFGTVTSAPWADGHTLDFTVAPPPALLILLKNIDLPGLPIPGPTVDLVATFCDPTDKSQPPNGTTDDPEDSPRIVADRDLDGDYESLATAIDQVRFDIQGWCRGYRCDDGNDCTIDHCNRLAQGWCTWDSEPNGTACDFNGEPGECDGVGNCGAIVDPAAPCDPLQASCTKIITLGCTNNLTTDVTMQTIELTVTPDPLVAGTVVPVNYSGVVVFPEFYLDGAQGVPGGVIAGDLIDAQATVHVRSGATALDVILTAAPLPLPGTCFFDQASCDPANDEPSVPGARGNTDCVPVGTFNPCQQLVAFPTSTDCGIAGTCAFLGKSNQCNNNGFCITGPLLIPLQDVDTTITPDASGQVLFGWDDQSTGAALNPDGTWNLPPAVFNNPTGPNGIKLNEAGLLVSLECTMGVDSGGPFGPVPPVPDQSSPTPDSHLINFPIQVP